MCVVSDGLLGQTELKLGGALKLSLFDKVCDQGDFSSYQYREAPVRPPDPAAAAGLGLGVIAVSALLAWAFLRGSLRPELLSLLSGRDE